MCTALLKRLQQLEESIGRKTQHPIAHIEVENFCPADRDAYLEGDDSVLTRYRFDPDGASTVLRAIVISVHPDHREAFVDMADMDDEAFERMERQREREHRRCEAEELERRQLEAIMSAQREQSEQAPPAPCNAYSPLSDPDLVHLEFFDHARDLQFDLSRNHFTVMGAVSNDAISQFPFSRLVDQFV